VNLLAEAFHTDYCICGGGPAALLCAALLRQKGADTLIVSPRKFGMLTPVQAGGQSVTPTPIFPWLDSTLFTDLLAGALDAPSVLRAHYWETIAREPERCPGRGSHAEFLRGFYDDPTRATILAEKHLGAAIYVREMPEVRRKVSRHYPAKSAARQKAGYYDGLSPYYVFLRNAEIGPAVDQAVCRVAPDESLVTAGTVEIRYRHLISTIPLWSFLGLAGMETELRSEAGGAQFVLMTSEEEAEPNLVVYDCDSGSAVYRVFTPLPRVLVVQVAHAHWKADVSLTANRVATLLRLKTAPVVERVIEMPGCYPLGVSDEPLKEGLLRSLREKGIVSFGRFAEWRYADLDDLDWGSLGLM